MLRYLFIIIIFSVYSSWAQTVHRNAHAHNDYEHSQPLFEALYHGFVSVEADTHLVEGKLYVSHNRPDTSTAKTLKELYLNPLDSLSRLNGGMIYPHYSSPFLLLIDIKTGATPTLQALIEVLKKYPALFPSQKPDSIVQVIVSGNRDYELILSDNRLAIDGRPDDLGKGYSSDKMPFISDNYKHWRQGDERDVQRIKALAIRVHAENKILRLWAIPDNEEAWQLLLDAGVDLINSNKLSQLNDFLVRKGR